MVQSWPELQIRITQLAREASPPPGLRLSQTKLSRKSNQIARGRIRQFESYMPSQTVRLSTLLRALDRAAFLGARDREAVTDTNADYGNRTARASFSPSRCRPV
jgi:hypothetical protein